MKKTLLLGIVTTVLATSASADSNALYLRADGGVNLFTKEKVKSSKYKTDLSGSVDLGIGYKVMDTVRAELVYSHYFTPTAKYTGEKKVRVQNQTVSKPHTTSSKAKIDTLMVRGYVDVLDAGPAKLFVGAGIGLAQVKEEVSGLNTRGESWSRTFRKKNNLAYTLIAGAGFGVADGVYIDLQYNWSDFGKAKGSSLKRRSNALKAGIRLEL